MRLFARVREDRYYVNDPPKTLITNFNLPHNGGSASTEVAVRDAAGERRGEKVAQGGSVVIASGAGGGGGERGGEGSAAAARRRRRVAKEGARTAYELRDEQARLHKPAPGYLYATRLPISGLTST